MKNHNRTTFEQNFIFKDEIYPLKYHGAGKGHMCALIDENLPSLSLTFNDASSDDNEAAARRVGANDVADATQPDFSLSDFSSLCNCKDSAARCIDCRSAYQSIMDGAITISYERVKPDRNRPAPIIYMYHTLYQTDQCICCFISKQLTTSHAVRGDKKRSVKIQ